MKRIKQTYYAVLGVMALGITACTQSEDVALASYVGQEINASFTVGGVQSRVNTLDERANAWEQGDKIKVQLETADGVQTTSELMADYSEGYLDWTRHPNFRWQDDSNHTFWVSYPSDYSYTEYNLPKDQSSSDNIKKADYINGKTVGTPMDMIVVSLQHRMSKITINCVLGSAESYADATIENPTILSQYSTAEFDKVTGYMTATGGELLVQAYLYQQDGVNKISAIIIPCSLDNTDNFLTFSVNGTNYVARLMGKTKFEEGHQYTFDLKIGKNKVEMIPTSMDNLSGWDVDNEEELK